MVVNAVRLAGRAAALRTLALAGDPLASWLRGTVGRDPYRDYERMRARGPIMRGSTGLYAVTSRTLCDEVLRDRRCGVRRVDGGSAFPASLGGREPDSALGSSFMELDGPSHSRLRRIVAPSLRPARCRELSAVLSAALDATLDRARSGSAPIDLMSAVAYPYPIAAVASLLGIPETDRGDFARIGALVARALDGIRTLAQGRALRAAEHDLGVLLNRLLDERAVDPRDDLLSVIAAARRDGVASERDAVRTAQLLLITGFETTTHLIGNGVAALLQHPDRWHALLANPDLAAAVVEETLRWDPPVQATGRVTHTEIELAGRRLPRDSVLIVLTAAANRDPDCYRAPDVFDVHRSGEPEHLSFSAGPHYCLGASLARLEGELFFRTLAARFPGLRLAGEPRRRPGATIRGYDVLPVHLC